MTPLTREPGTARARTKAELAALCAWLHDGGWVEAPGGCTKTTSGVDSLTREPYHHVTTWRDCANRPEHEVMAASALAALRAAADLPDSGSRA